MIPSLLLLLLCLISCVPPTSCDDLTVMVSLDGTKHYIEIVDSLSNQNSIRAESFKWCSQNVPDSSEVCTEMIHGSLNAQLRARASPTLNQFKISTQIPNSNLIVIDNFFEDPDKLREFALKQDFAGKARNSEYNRKQHFRRTRSFSGDPNMAGVRRKIEEVLGAKTVNWESVEGEGENMSFQVTYNLEGEFATHCVHTDKSDWGGILYLSPNPPASSGTNFVRHKELGLRKPCEIDGGQRGCGGEGGERIAEIDEVWKGDKFDAEKWEVVDTVGNVYNRMVLFNATNFHRSSGYFGDGESGVEGGRLFMNFFFDLDKR